MKFNRKTLMTIFLLFLFSGSIIISAVNIFMKPPAPASTAIAVMETSLGTIEIELDAVNAPITVANFKSYAEAGFYDGLVFHRVMREFMIQGGGFDTDGAYKVPGDPIQSEANNGLSNIIGTIAMARTEDPNSATSQFYINTVNNTFLDYAGADAPGYTVFGKVIKGLDVVEAIEAVDTTTKEAYFADYDFYQPMENWPVDDVVIISVTITEP